MKVRSFAFALFFIPLSSLAFAAPTECPQDSLADGLSWKHSSCNLSPPKTEKSRISPNLLLCLMVSPDARSPDRSDRPPAPRLERKLDPSRREWMFPTHLSIWRRREKSGGVFLQKSAQRDVDAGVRMISRGDESGLVRTGGRLEFFMWKPPGGKTADGFPLDAVARFPVGRSIYLEVSGW